MSFAIKTKSLPEYSLNSDQRLFVYNGFDAAVTHEVDQNLSKRGDIPRAVYEFERSMIGPVLSMMQRGLRVDIEGRDARVAELKERIYRLTGMVRKGGKWRIEDEDAYFQRLAKVVTGKCVNPNSTPQVQDLLYINLGVPEQFSKKKQMQGKVTVDQDALEYIEAVYSRAVPLCKAIITHSKMEKELGLLETPLLEGRYKYSLNIGGTETGRYSSDEHPLGYGGNCQNIPDRSRRLFIPDPGYIFFNADLEQAESWGVGYLSGDEAYLEALSSDDIHTYVCRYMFPGIPWTGNILEDKAFAEKTLFYGDKSYRFFGKRGGHGTNYGLTPRSMARQLKIPTTIAEMAQQNYFEGFPGISKWHNTISTELETKGILTTPLGRRRQFWGRLTDQHTFREALAYKPQSTISDITKIGTFRIWRDLEREGIQILADGHDAILGQCPIEKVDSLMPRVLDCMKVSVPIGSRTMTIPSDVSVGLNWGKKGADNPNGLHKWRGNV